MRPEPAADPYLRAKQFLRICLRRPWTDFALDEARTVTGAPGFDWAAVGQAAAAERLGPLLYHLLRSEALAPPEVLQAWRQAYLRCGQRNLVLFHELGQALRRLGAAGLDVVALKGAVLVPLTYGNIALRPMRDFDLLLRPEDVAAALNALEGLDLRPLDAGPPLDTLLAYECQVRVGKLGPEETIFELHWGLLDSPFYQGRLSLAELWPTSGTVEIDGVPTRVPAAEWHLLYLCAHLWLHHRGLGLLRWLDIAQLIRASQSPLDWDGLLAQAERSALVLPLQRTLAALAADWAVPLPPEVLRQAAGLSASPGEVQVFERLSAGRRAAGRRFWHDLAAMPGWRNRLRFAWANLFPPPAYMRQRYNIQRPLLLPAFYVFRWYLGLRGLFNSNS